LHFKALIIFNKPDKINEEELCQEHIPTYIYNKKKNHRNKGIKNKTSHAKRQQTTTTSQIGLAQKKKNTYENSFQCH